MEIGKTRKIFKNKPSLCWDNYFSGNNMFDHAGKKGYVILSKVRHDCIIKVFPEQYMNKKGTGPRNFVVKCSRFKKPITIFQKEKIQSQTVHTISFMYRSN